MFGQLTMCIMYGLAKRDSLQFRIELANQLIGNYTSRKCPGRPISSERVALNA